ncbi:MAG: GNAT family N-acetyltransferase [Planctomycetes bacterium]|nr:GNAT family N-acetyltransferase [Planctomycetota bacterium]
MNGPFDAPSPPGSEFDLPALGARSVPSAAFDAPASAWNRAVDPAGTVDTLCARTEWLWSFHEVFLPARPLLCWQRGDDLLAFAASRVPGIGPVFEPIETHWLFGACLLGTGATRLLWDVLVALQRGQPAHAPRAVLVSGLVDAEPLLEQGAAVGLPVFGQTLAPVQLRSASLAGGIGGWLMRRSGHFRRRLRAGLRRVDAEGVTAERHCPSDATSAAELYERMLDVERRSWKGLGACGMAEPGSREFYGVMLRRLAAGGHARVLFARHRGHDVGFVFGGCVDGIYRGQQFSFDASWTHHSLGNWLQWQQLLWLTEAGAERYDLGPLMDYKVHWAEQELRSAAVVLRFG